MSNPIELTTEEPQRNKKHTWVLYWFHATDPDASHKADEETLAKAGYVRGDRLLQSQPDGEAKDSDWQPSPSAGTCPGCSEGGKCLRYWKDCKTCCWCRRDLMPPAGSVNPGDGGEGQQHKASGRLSLCARCGCRCRDCAITRDQVLAEALAIAQAAQELVSAADALRADHVSGIGLVTSRNNYDKARERYRRSMR